MNSQHKVLVVDDDEDILEILIYNLEKEGYTVFQANNGEEAVQVAKEASPHLIIMDIMMPVMDGIEACRQIRDISGLNNTHIIFLTARAEEYSEVAAFDSGANDYIVKPIKPRALMSRVNSFFKRTPKNNEGQSEQIRVGDLIIDRKKYLITSGTKIISLPKKEFELLYFLAKKPNHVFSRDALLKNIWGEDVYVLARTVDVHVRKIREKIGEGYISTVKGVGYKLEPNKNVSE